MKLNDVILEAASPAQQAAIAIAKKKKAGMVKEQQLDEFAPLLAAGARLFMAAAPKIAQVLGQAGQAGARGAGQAARAGTEIAAKNAGKIGMGAGAYEIGSSVADIAKDIAAKVGTAIDEKTLLDLSALAFKYAIPAGIVLAVLYGGKKAIDSLFDEPKDQQGVAEANIQPTSAASRSHIGNLSNPVTNSVVHPSSGKEIGLITMQPTGEYYAQPTSTALANSQGGTFATKDEAHQFIRNAHAKAIKNGTLSDKWLKKQPLPQFAKGQGVAEGKADYNFDIEDLKRLEQIRDLSTLKAQALALISKPSAKPMKPEKVEWFKNALERMNSPLKVIKLMYDLLLSGEGNAVVGSRSSMNPNSYRQRFSEQGVAEDANLNYIWIQGDFDGDTASSGVTQGSWRDQQSTPVKLTRGRMTNVRPLSGPPPEGGKTIKQAQIPLTLDAGKEKFSTTGVDLQLTVAPNGYITNGEVGRVRGTAVVKIMRPESVEEDLTRRGFLRGLGMAAAGAAGLGAAGAAQARAPGEWQAKVERAKALMAKGQSREQTARIMGIKGPNPGGAGPMSGDWGAVNYAAQEMRVKEEYNPEYDDEAGMADNNLETLQRAVEGIDDLIQSGDNLPEWCQEKIAVAKSMLVAVWDYMYSEEASDEVDPEIDAMFEAMQELVAEMAVKNRVSEDLVWEQFEAMPDNVLYETAAWRRKEGKSKKGGLNAKGVASYRRENPGSKLQMAVTTKPSKLKKGSKASKRRKSFCARMSGVKGPMKKPNGKPTRKALALRKWNC